MLSWPDALCQHLADGGRRVVHFDLGDTGESTARDPEAHRESGADNDAADNSDHYGRQLLATPALVRWFGCECTAQRAFRRQHELIDSALTSIDRGD